MTTRESGGIDHRHLAVSPGAADSSAGSASRNGIISVSATLTPAGIHDSAGRYLAPPQGDLYERPMGPWNDNAAPLRVICAWHADFNPHDPANAGASHGMCAECAAAFMGETA